jgi:hypothetical protein
MESAAPPPRAFTQGVGTVFQFTGVSLFLTLMFVCCVSGLLSPSTAIRKDLAGVGWGRNPDGSATYSAPRAMTVSLATGIFCGIALAGLGLGLQATHRRTPLAAIVLCTFGTLFYVVHCVFFATTLRSWGLLVVCGGLSALFILLLMLSINAWKEMRRSPPPKDFEVLPADYKVPYSHLHQDPPDVRLAKELADRKQKLAVQQKELDQLEEKIKRTRNEPE